MEPAMNHHSVGATETQDLDNNRPKDLRCPYRCRWIMIAGVFQNSGIHSIGHQVCHSCSLWVGSVPESLAGMQLRPEKRYGSGEWVKREGHQISHRTGWTSIFVDLRSTWLPVDTLKGLFLSPVSGGILELQRNYRREWGKTHSKALIEDFLRRVHGWGRHRVSPSA